MSCGTSAPQRKNTPWSAGCVEPARATSAATTSTHAAAPPAACELLPGPADVREQLAVERRGDESRSSSCRRPRRELTPTAGTPCSRRSSRSVSVLGLAALADQRVREQGAEDALAPAVQRRVEREVLVGRDVRDEPALERRRAAASRSGSTPSGATRAGTSTTASSAQERQRAAVAHVDDVTVVRRSCRAGSRAARPPPRSRTAPPRCARAAPASRRRSRPRRGAAAPLDPAHLLGARLVRLWSLDDIVVVVEVVQVIRRDDPSRRTRSASRPVAGATRVDVLVRERRAARPRRRAARRAPTSGG